MGVDVANTVLSIIESSVNVIFINKYFRWNLITLDPDDNKFVDCVISCNAKYLVTNDKHFNILKEIEFPKIDVVDILSFEAIIDKLNQ